MVRVLSRRGARRGAVRGRWCGLDGPTTSRGHSLEVNPLHPSGRRTV
ncbi:hypothetical protein C349_07208 [Cryptococcus neoformans var. grubii Br795]|nr:hypothetical protein C349_07208 [Cryptococcus neoformans var. grubii Br795]OXH00459.1 hypothetical protein C369_07237 [Cryptococcus neoformans var. grubii A5-35-17]